ncbi:hypothetical protein PA598K_03529 [Paenibacillus sp. 598K]|nr:hypothetical protein PA598K_03529 [Paenibacillus sp. 598K]
MLASGRIFQRCGEAARIYYEAPDAPASAIVRIDNDTRCTMVVRIEQQRGRELGGTVEQGQQVSFAAPSLIRVKIECPGSSGICKGFYRIQLLR